MKCYNVYYKNLKLNQFPLKDKEINAILSNRNKVIRKMMNDEIIDIPIDKLKIIKCTIV